MSHQKQHPEQLFEVLPLDVHENTELSSVTRILGGVRRWWFVEHVAKDIRFLLEVMAREPVQGALNLRHHQFFLTDKE